MCACSWAKEFAAQFYNSAIAAAFPQIPQISISEADRCNRLGLVGATSPSAVRTKLLLLIFSVKIVELRISASVNYAVDCCGSAVAV